MIGKQNITIQGSKYYKRAVVWGEGDMAEEGGGGAQPNQEEGNMGSWQGLTQFTQAGG